jgi:hypothetical protein
MLGSPMNWKPDGKESMTQKELFSSDDYDIMDWNTMVLNACSYVYNVFSL